jgi:hypothetical protein
MAHKDIRFIAEIVFVTRNGTRTIRLELWDIGALRQFLESGLHWENIAELRVHREGYGANKRLAQRK